MSLWSRIERRLSDLAGELIPDEFRLQLERARELVEAGDHEQAVKELEALLGERPDHVGALSLMGAARLEQGDSAGALDAFDRALAQGEDMPEVELGRGEACLALDQTEPATHAFRTAERTARGDRTVLSEAYRGLGLCYRRRGDFDKAVRELRKAVAEAPEDGVALAALGDTLLVLDHATSENARGYLERALAADDKQVVAWLGLGRIALRENRPEQASESFTKALRLAEEAAAAPTSADEHLASLIGLGDAKLLADDSGGAHEHYLRALELDPRRARIHARIGDVHRHVANFGAALESYERALLLQEDVAVLRTALDVALQSDSIETAVRLANRMLESDPEDQRALVARGIALASDGQSEPARVTFRLALRRGDDLEARIALGELDLDASPAVSAGANAAIEALAALRLDPRNARARSLLARARARQFEGCTPHPLGSERGRDSDEGDLYQLAAQLAQLTATSGEVADLSAEATQATTDFDQPLLVTVMGEFSCGKSTFVNAFIADEAAPTGITPTTATINVVKYGREPGGRILYQDGRVETLSWQALFPALRDIDAEKARRIRVAEILLPLQQLERVNIVDTPGLNSILPEHEAVARGFIKRADAVIWLFTAQQAAKKSERDALESIRREGARVLGVLNKTDQLAPKEVDELLDHVSAELGELIEAVIPFSARQAFEWRRTGGGESGNWEGLSSALEERFFAQSRDIKRQVCDRRLHGLIRRAGERIDARRESAAQAASTLDEAAQEMRQASKAFAEEVVARTRREVSALAADLYRRAAREVLELVRPRRLPFGSHSATRADRDYLISLLDSGYEAALERSSPQVASELDRRRETAIAAVAEVVAVVGNEAVGDIARTADDAIRLVEARVFARCRAYLRGYIRGGYVDAFFRSDLPKLQLDEDSVYHALFRSSPDLDNEIATPLLAAGQHALDALAERLTHWAGVAEVMAYDLEVGAARTLAAIDEAGRGPAIGPMVVAAVCLDTSAARTLTRAGARDSKSFGAGARARTVRAEMADRVREVAVHVALEVLDVDVIDPRVCKNELNALEREAATRLIAGAPACDSIIADGERLFGSLSAEFPHLTARNRAESAHAAVAAASIVAKARRDALMEEICQRYAPAFGEITGGGYMNEGTKRFLRAYAERHGDLPPEARRSWPYDYLRDILGKEFDPRAALEDAALGQLSLFRS